MALNPSNNVADGFPTLGDPPFNTVAKETALMELVEAGVPRGSSSFTTSEVQVWKEGTNAWKTARSGISFPGMGTEEDKEWVQVHSVKAEVFGWEFSRSWYYWAAAMHNGAPIPLEEAVHLDNMWGQVLRVNGHGGGQRPTGTVGSYHIDRPDGLEALIGTLKRLDEERREAFRKKHDL